MSLTPTAIIENARPDPVHIRLFTNADVAAGFECEEASVRVYKSRHKDELLKEKHWIEEGGRTLWSVRGVIQLGFRMEGKRAAEFRSACEEILMQTAQEPDQEAVSVPFQNETPPKNGADRPQNSGADLDSYLRPKARSLAMARVRSRLEELVEEEALALVSGSDFLPEVQAAGGEYPTPYSFSLPSSLQSLAGLIGGVPHE